MSNLLFTSESVTEGHPDKICDQVSDAVLDAYLEKDPAARVACETAAATGMLLVMGEVTANCTVDVPAVARETLRRIGYGDPQFGFDALAVSVLTALNRQSPDIALGVNSGGAGDQGMMFGYATDETDAFMSLPVTLAHGLTRRLAQVRKSGALPWLGPDGKAQVTVEYKDGAPVRVDTVVISTQHTADTFHEEVEAAVIRQVALPVLPNKLMDENTRFLINPTGRFVTGGPRGDTGLTGRKIIVDTYGGFARHGGGAFSGKDPTKVDRSAAYAARHVAKNLVAAGIAKRLEIQIAYAIGVAQPVSVSVDTFGTGGLPDAKILDIVNHHFDLRPSAIIERLGLRRPIYEQTAAYGHFGRDDLDLPWERLDMVQRLRDEL
ncbi:MAG: methionine adenosyltransferase [Christensenellaceae bacterium]|jgi:S-adenosylmethionine synthetase|nr:methionine adenosyltransferase [Christensenellaceae bacterium]